MLISMHSAMVLLEYAHAVAGVLSTCGNEKALQ